MGPIFYVMAILGCGEADAACQQVDVAQAQYQSIEACNAATPEELERRVDLAFPVVVAQCQKADSKLAALSAKDVALPEPEAAPSVRPASATPGQATLQLASRR
jgi:hypothetical protein